MSIFIERKFRISTHAETIMEIIHIFWYTDGVVTQHLSIKIINVSSVFENIYLRIMYSDAKELIISFIKLIVIHW